MENIKKHYDKYGNTNLITESGLSNNVFAIGDSHSIFFHNSMRIIEHWGHCLTMYSLINNGIDINNLGNILKNGHEKYNINEKDVVMTSIGPVSIAIFKGKSSKVYSIPITDLIPESR